MSGPDWGTCPPLFELFVQLLLILKTYVVLMNMQNYSEKPDKSMPESFAMIFADVICNVTHNVQL